MKKTDKNTQHTNSSVAIDIWSFIANYFNLHHAFENKFLFNMRNADYVKGSRQFFSQFNSAIIHEFEVSHLVSVIDFDHKKFKKYSLKEQLNNIFLFISDEGKSMLIASIMIKKAYLQIINVPDENTYEFRKKINFILSKHDCRYDFDSFAILKNASSYAADLIENSIYLAQQSNNNWLTQASKIAQDATETIRANEPKIAAQKILDYLFKVMQFSNSQAKKPYDFLDYHEMLGTAKNAHFFSSLSAKEEDFRKIFARLYEIINEENYQVESPNEKDCTEVKYLLELSLVYSSSLIRNIINPNMESSAEKLFLK